MGRVTLKADVLENQKRPCRLCAYRTLARRKRASEQGCGGCLDGFAAVTVVPEAYGRVPDPRMQVGGGQLRATMRRP